MKYLFFFFSLLAPLYPDDYLFAPNKVGAHWVMYCLGYLTQRPCYEGTAQKELYFDFPTREGKKNFSLSLGFT